MHFDLSWWARLVVRWETKIYVRLFWTRYRPYQQPRFYSHQGLMNRSQHPLNIPSARTSIVLLKGQ